MIDELISISLLIFFVELDFFTISIIQIEYSQLLQTKRNMTYVRTELDIQCIEQSNKKDDV